MAFPYFRSPRSMLFIGLIVGGVAAWLAFGDTSPWGPVRDPLAAKARVAWTFEPAERGAIVSTPWATQDHVYIAAIHDRLKGPAGAVYCVDRASGKQRWRFDDEGRMLHMYSSAVVVDGRLYVGEGMHANFVCKMYCLNAATGRKQWDFAAAGHIESTPSVANGRLYFAAGDDGVHCLDAASGNPRWHFNQPLHIDSSPHVAGEFVYVGSGKSRRFQETAVLALRTDDGSVAWRVPTDLPVWAAPLLAGDALLVGIGNGRLMASVQPPEKPAGAMLCLNAADGRQRWRFDTADGVLAKAAASAGRVYFASRDAHCYCVDLESGQLIWKRQMTGPIVAAPALSGDHLYVAASNGTISCLEAANGATRWEFDVAVHSRMRPRLFSSPLVLLDSAGASNERVCVGAELQGALQSAAMLYCLEEY